MKRKVLIGLCWLCFWLILSSAGLTAAQSSTPEIAQVLVELWPEYDRPEVLVLYQVRLTPETPLPTEVTFRLPPYITEMHVVAVEENGQLFEAPPEIFSLRQDADAAWLTLSISTPNFQFEYYDPLILSQQAQTRTLDFTFAAPYDVDLAIFQIQEPAASQNFVLNPAAQNSFIGNDGLKYSSVERLEMAVGDMASLAATYQRDTTALSVQLLADAPVVTQSPGVEQPVEALATSDNRNFGYLLIVIGAVLFLGAIGSWWWSKKRAVPQQHLVGQKTNRRRVRTGRQKIKRDTSPATYCYRCGTQFRGEASFCHACGTQRRQIS